MGAFHAKGWDQKVCSLLQKIFWPGSPARNCWDALERVLQSLALRSCVEKLFIRSLCEAIGIQGSRPKAVLEGSRNFSGLGCVLWYVSPRTICPPHIMAPSPCGHNTHDCLPLFRGRHRGVEKRGGWKTSRMTPLPQRGLDRPRTVRFPHPSRVSALFFLYKNPRQSRTEALLEGSQKFQESAFFGTFSSPLCSPPYHGPTYDRTSLVKGDSLCDEDRQCSSHCRELILCDTLFLTKNS